MNIPVDWLLQGEPWIEYRTRVELLEQSESDPQVRAARKGFGVLGTNALRGLPASTFKASSAAATSALSRL